MALQILARIPQSATPYDKIREINRFIFEEMHFRFPPHSLYAKRSTSTPSSPPSSIAARASASAFRSSTSPSLSASAFPSRSSPLLATFTSAIAKGCASTNIETTARGINLPSETYLGIDTRRLQQRTMKEVIGTAFINEASVAWMQENYEKAVELYLKAAPFLPDDPLHKFLLGLNYLFIGKKAEAKKLLSPLQKFTFDHAVSAETIPDDYFAGRVDANGIKLSSSMSTPIENRSWKNKRSCKRPFAAIPGSAPAFSTWPLPGCSLEG